MIKRPDMIGNVFNPNRVENLKQHWGSIKHHKKTVRGRVIGKDEKMLIEYFEEHSVPFIYIGNSGFNIGKYFPDFINKNGTTVLEFIADSNKEIDKRRKVYEKHGFNFLFIRTNWITRQRHSYKILEYLKNELVICSG